MPGLISDHILDQIRQGNDVVEVIGAYFPLKRAGANFRALCPFHKEKTPSFNVHPQKQIWHCFGCGAGGDVFKFVMMYENLAFIDAVRRLAERAGIRIELEKVSGGPTRDQKDALYKLHEQVATFFHHNLLKEPAAEIARTYLKSRQINAETAKKWQIGYSPDAWDALIEWAKQKKFTDQLLATAGLILRRERGDGFYDRFRGRLMFPIRDDQGRVVGFSGRILTDAKDQPKYVNSPETPIFQKGKILFAMDKAKRAILDEKFAVICEGQIDAISCHEAGLANVVAPQGTALTEQHARVLKRHTDDVVLIFDSDAAGQNAAVRSAEPLITAGLVIRVAVLPAGHDPDSFIKQFGGNEFKMLVTKAPSFFVFLLDRLVEQSGTKSDRGKLQVARQMVEVLSKLPDPILRSTYVRQTAARLDIPEDAILQELRKTRTRRSSDDATGSSPESQDSTTDADRLRSVPGEELLLQMMLNDERVIARMIERLNRDWLSDTVAAELINNIMDSAINNRWSGPHALLNAGLEQETERLLSELLLKPPVTGVATQVESDCLATMERRWAEGRLRELRKLLAQKELDSSSIAQLQQQILDLRNKLDHIAELFMEKS